MFPVAEWNIWVTLISSWREEAATRALAGVLFTLGRSKDTYLPLSKHHGYSSTPITFPVGGLKPPLQKGFNPILAT